MTRSLLIATLLAFPTTTVVAEVQRHAERPLIFGVNRVGGSYATYEDPDYDEHMYRRLQEMGGTMVRLAASPRDIERVRGVRDWTAFERDLELALKYDQEPMICIVNTPLWALPEAASTVPAGMDPSYQYAYDPELFPEFIDFCYDLAKRTQGKARLFQLWNEQNGCSWHFHDGWNHADEYIPFLEACRKGLKMGNPEAILLMGSFDDAEGNAPIFLNKSYDEVAEHYQGRILWDGLSTHPYSHTVDEMRDKLDALRAIQAEHGDGHLPIYITEYGWHTRHTTLEYQAEIQARFLEAFSSPDYDFLMGVIHLCLADFEGNRHGFGLCDANLRPRPSYYAFQGAPRFGASPAHYIEVVPISGDSLEFRWKTKLPTLGALTLRPVGGGEPRVLHASHGTEHTVQAQGLAPDSAYTYRIVTWTDDGKTYSSAEFQCRTPGRQVFNGAFDQGFFAGIANGWEITGEGFCANAANIGDVTPSQGNHAQVLWGLGFADGAGQPNKDRKVSLDSTMRTQVVAASGERVAASASCFAVSDVPLEARVGLSPPGRPDQAKWSDWTALTADAATINVTGEAQGALMDVLVQCRAAAPFTGGRPKAVVEQVSVARAL